MSIAIIILYLLPPVLMTYIQEDILSPFVNEQMVDVRRKNKGAPYLETVQTKAPYKTFNVEPFRTKIQSKYIYGHVAVINDPRTMFSVLEPMEPGGCMRNIKGTVIESSKQRQCLVAVNGGFTNHLKSSSCYGNVISDGRVVQLFNSDVKHVNFGIRENGELVMGYLSTELIHQASKKNPFYQLVTGVGWILRDGLSYVNDSLYLEECNANNLKNFIGAKTARTFLGFDATGVVYILHVDGTTNNEGLTLHESVDFLRSFGILNAMNLDGAGSSSFAIRQNLVGYPSNMCFEKNNKFPCLHNISTILCVHEADDCVSDIDCDGNVICLQGHCVCPDGWFGKDCTLNSQDIIVNDWKMYYFVVGLSIVVAVLLLFNICVLNLFLCYRARFKDLMLPAVQRRRIRDYLRTNKFLLSSDESSEDLLGNGNVLQR